MNMKNSRKMRWNYSCLFVNIIHFDFISFVLFYVLLCLIFCCKFLFCFRFFCGYFNSSIILLILFGSSGLDSVDDSIFL